MDERICGLMIGVRAFPSFFARHYCMRKKRKSLNIRPLNDYWGYYERGNKDIHEASLNGVRYNIYE